MAAVPKILATERGEGQWNGWITIRLPHIRLERRPGRAALSGRLALMSVFPGWQQFVVHQRRVWQEEGPPGDRGPCPQSLPDEKGPPRRLGVRALHPLRNGQGPRRGHPRQLAAIISRRLEHCRPPRPDAWHHLPNADYNRSSLTAAAHRRKFKRLPGNDGHSSRRASR